MRGWSTLALVVVFAGLVGYIYFVDSKQEPGGSTVKEKPFGSLQADDIEEVQIKSADGETTRLQKTDGKWQVVEPVKTAADTSELTTIASSLATFEIHRVVDENATDLKQYRTRARAPRGRLPVEGSEGPQAPPDRREDADRQRPLRPLPRSEAGVPRLVVPRHHVQQEHVRAARSPDSHLRSQQGRWTRAHERHDEDAPDKERIRLATRVADLCSCRLRGSRRRARTPVVHPDAGHRRSGRKGSREVRARRNRPARSRSTPEARARRSRSGQRRTHCSLPRTRRDRWSSPSRRCSRTT